MKQWIGTLLGWCISAHRVSDGEFLMWNMEVCLAWRVGTTLMEGNLQWTRTHPHTHTHIYFWRETMSTLCKASCPLTPRISNNGVSFSCADVLSAIQPGHGMQKTLSSVFSRQRGPDSCSRAHWLVTEWRPLQTLGLSHALNYEVLGQWLFIWRKCGIIHS